MKIVIVLGLMLLVAGCSHGPGPKTFAIHSPLQPAANTPVTLTATADDPAGIKTIEIWEERNILVPCRDGSACAAGPTRRQIATCEYPSGSANKACEAAVPDGYPDGSFVGYAAIATNRRGARSAEQWIYFAAGTFPWRDRPIPIYVTAPPERAIDLVVIPDAAGEPERHFGADLTALIKDTYLSALPAAEIIRSGPQRWNFYVTYSVSPPGKDRRCSAPPPNWNQLRAVVDVGVVLRHGADAGCIGLGPGSVMSIAAPGGAPALHALGHSVFALADKYCCDGAYWQAERHPNIYATKSACREHASSQSWPVSECVEISPPSWWRTTGMSGWYRSDSANDLMGDPDARDLRPGRADTLRIRAVYEQCAQEKC